MGESKHRFERLPDGSHAHHLSAPKRQQFLSNQVRRLRDLLEGRKDKEHYHHGSHHLHPDALEHPLSLLKEKLADFEGDRSSSPASFGSTAGKKKHSVKEEFVHKYGDLSQVVGKGSLCSLKKAMLRLILVSCPCVFSYNANVFLQLGAFGTVRLAVKKTPESAQESTSAVKVWSFFFGSNSNGCMYPWPKPNLVCPEN